MLNRFILFLSLFSALTFLFPKHSSAVHAALFEMSYRWTQDSTYQFTLVFYRNCSGIAPGMPSTISVSAKSVLGGTSSVNLIQLATSGTGVPPLEPPNLLNCTNNSYCYEEYVYRGNWTSPKRASDWLFSYALCCLPATNGPANISSSSSFYNECSLNNLDFPDQKSKNISPLFHNRRPHIPGYLNDTIMNYPFVSVCETRDVSIDQSARNYDGDKIQYSFYHPQTTGGAAATYINSYSFSDPLPTVGPAIAIDSTTGEITFKADAPTQSGVYYIGIKATEYRNDTVIVGGTPTVVEREIGFVKRNLFIMIEDSSTCQDLNFGFTDSTDVSTVVSDVSIACDNNPIELGMSIGIKCNSIESTGSDIVLVDTNSLDTIHIKKAIPSNCVRNGIAEKFRIYLDSALAGGVYRMMLNQGSDGNTFITECDLELDAFADTLYLVVDEAGDIGRMIADTNFGTVDSMTFECGVESFNVRFTKPVLCDSHKGNGSEFRLEKFDGTIYTHTGVKKSTAFGCGNGLSQRIEVETDSALGPGEYRLTLISGSDGNTLHGECYRELDSTSVYITILPLEVSVGPDFTYCLEDTLWDTIVSVPNTYDTYNWSTGSNQFQALIFSSGTYWVEVTNDNGCTASDTMVVSGVYCYVSIDEYHRQDIKIFPNPSRDFVTIEIQDFEKEARLELRSVEGQLVKQVQITNQNSLIDVRELESGTYFGRLIGLGKNRFDFKLVIE